MPSIATIQFAGLIRNRPLRSLTHGQLARAFRIRGWIERSDAGTPHFFQALQERGLQLGIHSLGDFERMMRNGTSRLRGGGRILRLIPSGRGGAVVRESDGSLITVTFVTGEAAR